MTRLISALAFGLGVSGAALKTRQASGCCFQINVSGGPGSGPLGQLGDGQNRVGTGYTAATYCLNGGIIDDSQGRGCILTSPTTQFQCDAGATGTSGFTIGAGGVISYNGDTTFYECEVSAGVYNIYTTPGGTNCSPITLTTAGGACASSSTTPVAPSTTPTPVSITTATTTQTVTGPGVTTVQTVTGPGSTTTQTVTGPGVTVSVTTTASCVPSTVISTVAGPTVTSTSVSTEITTVVSTATITAPPQTITVAGPTVISTVVSTVAGPTVTLPAQTVTAAGPTVVSTVVSTVAGPTVVSTVTGVCTPSTVVSTIVSTVTAPGSGSTVTETITAPGSGSTVTETVTAPGSRSTVTETVTAPGSGSTVTETVTAPGSGSTVTETITAPGGGSPATSVPATSVPATSVPATSVPATSVPATSVPATSVPSTPTSTIISTIGITSTVTSPPTSTASSCAVDTIPSGNFQYPHLIVPVSSVQPNTAYGTQYSGTIDSTTSTIFNFDIPASYAGETCTLAFLLPLQSQLTTSSYTLSGSGGIEVLQLSAPATQSTTYNTVPSVSANLGTFPITAGSSTIILTSACAAGQTLSYELVATGTLGLTYFQDYNPSAIGLYITEC